MQTCEADNHALQSKERVSTLYRKSRAKETDRPTRNTSVRQQQVSDGQGRTPHSAEHVSESGYLADGPTSSPQPGSMAMPSTVAPQLLASCYGAFGDEDAWPGGLDRSSLTVKDG